MVRILLAVFVLLTSLITSAQLATITGTITTNEGGRIEPLPFVSVVLKGTTTGASTDLDGKYLIKAEPGAHAVVVSFVGFETVVKSVTLVANETVTINMDLPAAGMQMEEFEVVQAKRTETESAVIMETRQSEQVVNGMSREQIGKSQDRTAGDVVKRIPGVTMVGDRFVMIRGLADRYNTVMLNDIIAPSLEPDRRAFSFDILPSGVLDRVMVYKTGAPELPGEFAGGVIKLYTMNVPNENETKINYSSSFRPGTTFGNFQQSQRSGTDNLGFDNGSRQLPVSFPGNIATAPDARVQSAGRSLDNNWTAQQRTAGPDQRLGLLIARRFGKQGARTQGGNVTSLNYSNTFQNYTAKNYNYNAFNPNTNSSDTIYNYSDNENTQQVRFNALSNFSLLVGSRTKLEFRNLFTQQGTDQTTVRTGRNFEEGSEVRNFAYRYQQRTIYSGQLYGEHELLQNVSKFSWSTGFGLALSSDPDLRRVRTIRDINSTETNMPFQVVIPPGATTLDAGRFYSTSNEKVYTGKLDYEHKITGERNSLKLRTGAYVERKDRSFEARWMSYARANGDQFDQSLLQLPLDQIFASNNIDNTSGFKLVEGTNPSDQYLASNTLIAGYFGTTLTLATNTVISAGVRAEHNTQELTSRTYGGRPVNVNNPVLSILPSINASRALSERSQVRLAWATTVNRPEFRELAPFSFYDFSMNNVLRGNDSVQTATIQNVDARYEFYPSTSELISFGVFYKRFTNPIEMFYLPGAGSGGTRNFTFGNAKQATSIGAELEIRKQLSGLFERGFMSRIGVMFNAAYILTKVQLGTEAQGQAQERPLMGQSPYIVNAGLYYQDTEHKLQYSVLYNVIGRRLYAVGTFGSPDIYEMPRNVVDIAVSKGFGKRFEVKLAAQDILNQRTRLVQDANNDGTLNNNDQTMMSYRRGAYFTVGLGLKF